MACDVSPVAIFKSNDYAEDLPIFCQPENWREEWGEDSTAERRGNFHRCYRYKWHLKLLQVQVTPQIATGDNSNCNGCRHLKLLLCAQCYVQLNQSCWIKSFDLFFRHPDAQFRRSCEEITPGGYHFVSPAGDLTGTVYSAICY